MRKIIIEYSPVNKMQQGGETSSNLTNAQMMTGAYITDQENPTVNIEKDEIVKNSQSQEIQKASGETHKNGGIDVNLPQGSQVLSDYTKVTKEEAKEFSEKFGIKVKPSDTYASVMDKVNSKIGWTKLIQEEEELIKKIEDVRSKTQDEKTLNINMKFLQDKYKTLNLQKAKIQDEQKEAFDEIFEEQESHAKVAGGQVLLDEKGEPMEQENEMKYGGEVYNLAKKYNVHPDKVYAMMQSGGEVNQQPQDMQAQIASAIQNGANPEDIIGQLIQQGIPHQEAMNIVQSVMQTIQAPEQENPVVRMIQEGMQPEQIVEVLTQNNVPMEQAVQMVQAVVSGNQQQQAEEIPVAQQGITTPPKTVSIDPRYAFYTPGQYDLSTTDMQESTYLHQPFVAGYEGKVSGGIDPNERIKYQSSQLPFLTTETGFYKDNTPSFENTWKFQKGYDEYLGSVSKAIDVNPYLKGEAAKNYKQKLAEEAFSLSKNPTKYKTTEGYDSLYGLETSEKVAFKLPLVKESELKKYPNIQRLSDVVDASGKVKKDYSDLSEDTKKILEETYRTSGKLGSDIGIGAVIEPPVETPTAPERQAVVGQNKPIERMGLPVLPSPYILPPSGLQPVGKWDISLGRVEPSKQAIEPYAAALSQQQLAGQRSNLQNLTPEAAAAANAMMQATIGAQTNQALGQTEEANRQAVYASELQNVQQADKEKISQAGINEAYQTKMYGAMNNTERDWRNYFNQINAQNLQNYRDVQGMQLLNAMTPDYQYTGSDVEFSNRPYETAQQKADRLYNEELLKWYRGLSAQQRAEEEKKRASK